MTGGCLCKKVRFTASGVAPEHSACHCGMCRQLSGGAPFFAARTTEVRFEGAEHITRYASSAWAERGFCSTCGTQLFYFLKGLGSYHMSVGTFDDPSPFRVTLEIFIDRKPDGYALAGDHPRWTEAETFARLAPPA